jgi:hypothetical membrane protein
MNKQKIGAAAGLATPVVAFTCISISIASWPEFNWIDNALSDLGVATGFTAPVFNFGLTAAGVLAFCFATLGIYSFLSTRLAGKVGATVFAAATIALTCIGIFNENFSPTHYIVSVAFFSLAPIGLFILTYAFWRSNQRALAALSVANRINSSGAMDPTAHNQLCAQCGNSGDNFSRLCLSLGSCFICENTEKKR